MELFDAIEQRHSYRGTYTEGRIPRRDLKQMVEAGLQAPSGCNAQTTSFVIVDEQPLIEAISNIVEKPDLSTAGAIIVAVMEKRTVYQDMSFGVEDYACAVENILLAVTALGYASVWIDGALRVDERAERIGERLGVPPTLQVRVILPVGRPAEAIKSPEKKPFGARAWFNQYDTES